MKKTLLILCACLFGALSGAKAWTSVDPENGKSYYLLNVEQNQFFMAVADGHPFYITSDLASATPIVYESSGQKFRFYVNGTAYKLYHDDGKAKLNSGGSKFSRSHDKDMGFEIYTGDKVMGVDTRRWLYVTEANGQCYFPKTDDKKVNGVKTDIHWKFVPVEEVYNELIKSTAPTCAAAAEASYLKPARGWTKIAELPANLDDYYYAIVSAEVPGLMLNAQAGGGSGRNDSNGKAVYYSTATEVDASQHLDYLWTITNNSAFNCQSFRNVEYNTYYMQTHNNNHAENIVAQYEVTPSEWTQMKFEYDENTTSWTILNQRYDGMYLGAWDKKVPENGLEFCGNNSKDGEYGRFVGHFLIYAVSKRDYTYKITNSDFSNGATGWNGIGSDKSQQFFINTEARFTGNMAEMWKDAGESLPAGDVNQTISGLPAGLYTLSAKVRSGLNCELYTSVGEQSLEIGGADGVFTRSFNFIVPETGDVTIGLKHNGVKVVDNWIAVDEFKLFYYGNTVDEMAEALPANGAMEAGKWYYFDIALAGKYGFIANALSNVVYTTDGNTVFNSDVANSFAAEDNDLTATRYYVKSSSDQKLQWYLAGGLDYNSRMSSAVGDWSCVTGKSVAVYPKNTTKGVEVYYGNNASFPVGNTLYQTINDLPNGNYEVILWAWENFAPWEKDSNPHPTGDEIAQVFANDAAYAINVIEDTNGRGAEDGFNDANKYTLNCHVTSGTLTYGVKNIAAGGNWAVCRPISLRYTGPYNNVVEDEEAKTQTYEGIFTESTEVKPTEECPIVDISGATFTGDIDVSFTQNPNGLVIATSSQKIAINANAGEPVKNVISTADNVCEKLVITDGTPFVAPRDFEATQATYSRSGLSNTFGTICVPFALESNEKIQYYTVTQISGDVLRLETADEVAAGVPAIFKKKDGEATQITASITGTEVKMNAAEQSATDVKLVGTFKDIKVGGAVDSGDANGKYYIKNDQFCEGVDYFNVGAFRAYLTAGDSPARLSLQIDDEATAINELKTLDEKQGLKDGKYLIGGKIIVVKDGKQFNVNGVLK